MRARFSVESVTKYSSGCTSVVLRPNIKGPNEKTKLWQGTPQGSLDMTITHPDAQDFFKVGKDYYLDFTLVESSADVD